jgi:hypothetical protein
VGLIVLLGGIDLLTGPRTPYRMAPDSAVPLIVFGAFLILMYFWIRTTSNKFRAWSRVSGGQKLIAWLTTLWIGFLVNFVLLPAVIVGTVLGIRDMRR